MFARLKAHRRIFVIGPHRSGTRIGAKIVSADTGRVYIDETRVWDSWIAVAAYSRRIAQGVVFHAPLLMCSVHLHCTADDCVVLMRRKAAACQQSARRMGIDTEKESVERQAWISALGASPEASTMAEFKYLVWEHVIRPNLRAVVHEVEYESLATHSLWVPPHRRQNWGCDRTALQGSRNAIL